jgi:hypothetical protein
MSAPAMTPMRHPWLQQFEETPERAFSDLLAGYADIHPYERADAPDAAHTLFAPLDPPDPARRALAPAILGWLERQRKDPRPAARPRLQRRVREVCEAFEIIALLDVTAAAVELRRRFVFWNDWVSRLVISSARDARAEYWRMLALTLPLMTQAGEDIDRDGLVPLWQQLCREAGAKLPRPYLSIGLLGLRRVPRSKDETELQWVSGLAQWALMRRPSDDEFEAEWLTLKPLYPRSTAHWRRLIVSLL